MNNTKSALEPVNSSKNKLNNKINRAKQTQCRATYYIHNVVSHKLIKFRCPCYTVLQPILLTTPCIISFFYSKALLRLIFYHCLNLLKLFDFFKTNPSSAQYW